ncbi:heat shock factor 2-binding protein-like [Physella acuta]|uniref:heat shock factor 2-binding protein-like n=1 Tax=Physella acuta TaxID=109671 RepID=UPI0027DDFFC3|nr:heat shock factor 2-binding protein-like [Physella acuta]
MSAPEEKKSCEMMDNIEGTAVDETKLPIDNKPFNELMSRVVENLQSVQKEWATIQSLSANSISPGDFTQNEVIVQKSLLNNLAVDSANIKALLLSLMTQNVEIADARIKYLEKNLEEVLQERNNLQQEVQHWKSQLENTVGELQREKKVQVNLKTEIQELTDQLQQQSDFCSSLGAASCTLLWRVSKHENTIETIISGSRSQEFLEIISSSVMSYLTAYKDDEWPNQNTDEAIFILSLCGVVTNIAATAIGREHISTSLYGCKTIDTFIKFIQEAPLTKSANMKILMLMSLYNISLNSKGIMYLSSRSDFIKTLCWHLKEEKDADNRISTMRLMQSLMTDENIGLACTKKLSERCLMHLEKLCHSSNREIKSLAQEIVSDMRAVVVED